MGRIYVKSREEGRFIWAVGEPCRNDKIVDRLYELDVCIDEPLKDSFACFEVKQEGTNLRV